MAKLVKVSEVSAYRVGLVQIKDSKFLSIRKMYKTQKTLDQGWKPARQGITVPLELSARVVKAMGAVLADPDQKVEILTGDKEWTGTQDS